MTSPPMRGRRVPRGTQMSENRRFTMSSVRPLLILVALGLCVSALACRRSPAKGGNDAGRDAPRADAPGADVPDSETSNGGAAGAPAADGGEPDAPELDAPGPADADAAPGNDAGDAGTDALPDGSFVLTPTPYPNAARA